MAENTMLRGVPVLLLSVIASIVMHSVKAAVPYNPNIEPPPYKSFLQPTPEGYPGLTTHP